MRLRYVALLDTCLGEPGHRAGARRPRGLRRWLRARPPRSRNHWIALVDPDMLALGPLAPAEPFRVSGGALGEGEADWRLQEARRPGRGARAGQPVVWGVGMPPAT